MRISLISLIALLILNVFSSCEKRNSRSNPENKIELSEKEKGTFRDLELSFEERALDLVSRLTIEEKVQQLRYDAPSIDRLGVPAYNWWNEALHGIARFGRATIFPQPIAMAATFDDELIFKVADAISTEGRAKNKAALDAGYHSQYGGLTYWSPNINIFRDPRWGRGMETWGEDPFLTGRLATSFVNGIQGSHPKYLKAAACAKHFAVHSGPEGDRHHFDAIPSKKDLHETYLPAFEQLVKEADVEAVMCAYNRLYGDPCCGSEFLLQDILRDEWGFDGHILSDCWAINDFHLNHQVTETQAQSAALAINSGVNLNCGDAYDSLMVAVEKGLIDEKKIDELLQRLLLTRFKLGLFDPADVVPFQYGDSVINSERHKKIAREAARKSVILLKNEGILPLNPQLKQLYVIGPMAANVDAMIGNYPGVSENIVTILEGISGAISPGTRMEYRKGFFMDRDNLNKTGWAIDEAKSSPVTIVVMGINNELEGEEGESIASPTKSDRVDLQLPPNQIEYLKEIRDNDGKPLIVVMTGGSPIAIQEVYELADAVIWAWYPGEQGGYGVADVIFGNTSPSGKLPITFPKSVDQLPPYDDYSMKGRTYKYMTSEPLFPFGFGLSYTEFAYELKLDKADFKSDDETINAEVSIINKGDVTSDEVVQIYVTAGKDTEEFPEFKLVDYKRINIEAGKTEKITVNIPLSAIMTYTEENGFQLREGNYFLHAGGSLPSERSYELGAGNAATAKFRIQ